jgi:ribosomal protein S18 acetylase RimI-like enzyme
VPTVQTRAVSVIRRATAEDSDEIARVHHVARSAYYGAAIGLPSEDVGDGDGEVDPERQEMWRSFVADNDKITVLCAVVDGQIVGFLSMGPPLKPHPSDERLLELQALYVLPGHWNAGVGSALYDAYLEQLSGGTYDAGILEVWSSNSRAIDFYRRRGWVSNGRSRPSGDGSSYDGMNLRDWKTADRP